MILCCQRLLKECHLLALGWEESVQFWLPENPLIQDVQSPLINY